MEEKNLEYLINIVFKILGLYEKIDDNSFDEDFTRENYIMYIEKTLVDLGGFVKLYKKDEEVSKVLDRCKFSVVGILELVKDGKESHKIIRSKILDMTNDISRCLSDDNKKNIEGD